MSDGGYDTGDGALNMFEEPEGFYPPEKEPTTAHHQMLNGKEISLRLVGHSPLWVGELNFLMSPLSYILVLWKMNVTTEFRASSRISHGISDLLSDYKYREISP